MWRRPETRAFSPSARRSCGQRRSGQANTTATPASMRRPRTALCSTIARALERGHALGADGLPLMGAGDWNDGMDRVGEKGRGRSVSLSWEAGAVNFRAHRRLSNSIIHGADATPVTVNGGS